VPENQRRLWGIGEESEKQRCRSSVLRVYLDFVAMLFLLKGERMYEE